MIQKMIDAAVQASADEKFGEVGRAELVGSHLGGQHDSHALLEFRCRFDQAVQEQRFVVGAIDIRLALF